MFSHKGNEGKKEKFNTRINILLLESIVSTKTKQETLEYTDKQIQQLNKMSCKSNNHRIKSMQRDDNNKQKYNFKHLNSVANKYKKRWS